MRLKYFIYCIFFFSLVALNGCNHVMESATDLFKGYDLDYAVDTGREPMIEGLQHWIEEPGQRFPELYCRYFGPVDEVEISPYSLDAVFQEWLNDDSSDRPTDFEIVRVLGSAFGNYLEENRGLCWLYTARRYDANTQPVPKIFVGDSTGNIVVAPFQIIKYSIERGEVEIFEAVDNDLKEKGLAIKI